MLEADGSRGMTPRTDDRGGQAMTVAVGLIRVFSVTGQDGGPSPTLDEETDAVMDALIAMEDATLTDSGVGADLASGTVEIEIVARAEDFDKAVECADAAIRAAIHAAGGHTPNWQSAKTLRQTAELVTA